MREKLFRKLGEEFAREVRKAGLDVPLVLLSYDHKELKELLTPEEYEAAVEEALCYGWIDSRTRKLDDERTLFLLSRRRPGSPWSRKNKQHVETLLAAGLMSGALLAHLTVLGVAPGGDPTLFVMALASFVAALALVYHPAVKPGMTEQALARIEAEARARWPLQEVLIVHRHGRLVPGARIVLVLTASAHRRAAFEAAEFLRLARWCGFVSEAERRRLLARWRENPSHDIASLAVEEGDLTREAEQAIEVYEKALVLRPREGPRYQRLGWSYMALGDHANTRKAYEQAMALGTAGFTAMLSVLALEDAGLGADEIDEVVCALVGLRDQVVLTGWSVGEKYWGGYSQRQRVQSKWLVPLPEGLDTRQAMAVGTAGFTAMLAVMALEDHGLQLGHGPVLVTGAAGGVGSVAVALLAALGHEVAGVTGRPETEAYLRELGATLKRLNDSDFR